MPRDCQGEQVATVNPAELATLDVRGKILLLHNEIAKGQWMPKNFVFYNPEEHRASTSCLRESSPELWLPPSSFPDDWDRGFDIPSAYITDVEGQRMLKHKGDGVPENGCGTHPV